LGKKENDINWVSETLTGAPEKERGPFYRIALPLRNLILFTVRTCKPGGKKKESREVLRVVRGSRVEKQEKSEGSK